MNSFKLNTLVFDKVTTLKRIKENVIKKKEITRDDLRYANLSIRTYYSQKDQMLSITDFYLNKKIEEYLRRVINEKTTRKNN